MIAPLEMERLAVRIETLTRVSTAAWGADSLEFRSLLPSGRDRRKLPDPTTLRDMARDRQSPSQADWQLWTTIAVRLEGMVRDNDPRNPRRIVRDIMTGRRPY